MNDSHAKGAGRSARVEDVARAAGVSPITVSRALSTPHKVKPATRERVAEAVASMGYVVNSIASSLRSGRSSIVAIFASSLRNPQTANAVQGALDAFEGSRFQMMLIPSGRPEELSPMLVDSVVPFRPAGVIFTGIVRSEAAHSAFRRLGVPMVEMWGADADPIDMLVDASLLTPVRMSDYEMGGLAGDMLLRRMGGEIAVAPVARMSVPLRARADTGEIDAT